MPNSSAVFAALGEPTRLRLIEHLSDGAPRSIARLAAGRAISRQALTKHLRVLETAGIVASERHGRESLYRLKPGALDEAQVYLNRVSAQWDSLIDRLKSHVES